MHETDIDYLRRRAADELKLAQTTTDVKAALIHQRMATIYEDRIAALENVPEFDPIAIVRLAI